MTAKALAFLSVPALEDLEAFVERIVNARLAKAAAGSPWLTVEEAAEYLRWPKKRLYNLTRVQAIPHRRHRSRILFRRDELDAWLDQHYEGPAVRPPQPLVRHASLDKGNGRAALERSRPGTGKRGSDADPI